MSAIVTFECGHERALNGSEEHPVCGCGNDRMVSVKAPAPRFRGHCLGPCAEFKHVPAAPVDLVSGTVTEDI